uniref:G_PROTEIN_RECEP_F1_2 domain-containing protein n=1 Tax=Panagrellus redivivus TaxID=6233 RepID=A0A7E4UY13_PANRE
MVLHAHTTMADMSTLLYFRHAKRHLALYAGPIGVALNLLLMWLVVKKSTPTMKSFKKVLLLTCLTDLTFSAMNIVFVLTLTVAGDTYFCIIEGVFGHLPPWLTFVGYDAFLYFVYASVSNNTVVVFYRYLVVCRSKTLNACLFMCCMGIGWSLILSYIFAINYQFMTESADPDIHSKLTAAGYPSNGSFHNYVSCRVNKLLGFSTYAAVPFTTIAYLAVIVMSFAVQRKFKRLSSLLNTEERRFHNEITMILWVEAVTPFITVCLPIYYDISKLIISNMPFNWFAEFIWLLTLIGPSFTAIFKLISIRAYRDYISKSIYGLFFKRKTTMNVVQISSSQHAQRSSVPKRRSNNVTVN